jgi:hypothetical protein
MTTSSTDQQKPSSQFNARLPHLTHKQITDLSEAYGLTKTQAIILAVDRLTRELKVESPEDQNPGHHPGSGSTYTGAQSRIPGGRKGRPQVENRRSYRTGFRPWTR